MESILNSINMYFSFLNSPSIGPYIFFGFLLTYVITIALRILVSVSYKVQQSIVYVNAKTIINRAGLKDTHSGLLNKIIKDYMRLGEKGVTLYTSRSIVEKHVSKMNFLAISCDGLEMFINSMEQGEILIGIVLTIVFEEFRLPFLVGTLSVFLILRVFSVFFNFSLSKARLIQEATEYIDREIGQFYIGDMSALFTKFRNEVSNSMHLQTESLADSIKKMGDNISGVMRLSIQETTKSTDAAMDKTAAVIKDINNLLTDWKCIVELSEKSQTNINEASGKLNLSSTEFASSYNKMSETLLKFTDDMKDNFGLMQSQINELKANSMALQNFSEPIVSVNASLQSQLNFIERNQALLESSMQKYELSLQELTANISEGFGSIVDYHIQNSYNSLNERLEENIKQIVGNNNGLIMRLQQLFEEIRQLSRSETQAIIKIKEQMDLHFDNLSEKMLVYPAKTLEP